MSDSSANPDKIQKRGDSSGAEPAALSSIDHSIRVPVVLFAAAAIAWLLVGSVFGLITSFKLHTAGFLGNWEWLTYGRVRPATTTVFLYGWATNAGFAAGFWIMARLSRNLLQNGTLLNTAAVFWNIGVLVAVAGILLGDLNAREGLEMPGYAAPILLLAFVFIAVWTVLTFCYRRSRHAYVSQWYILAALFWFPAIFGIAMLMTVYAPARGILQSVVGWWYTHNLYALWLTPLGLAAVYYIIPKVLGKPVHSYYLASAGFWSYLFFASWAGMHHLSGGPVPAWIVSTGVTASLLVLFPVFIIGLNHHLAMKGNFAVLRTSPGLRFAYFGAVAFTAVSVVAALTSFRSVKEVLHFTHFTDGQMQWGLYAWFTMAMFGAFYYFLPRVLGREWPSSTLIRVHFWSSASGIVLYVFAMCIGGWIQGSQMNNPEAYPDFVEIVRNTLPWLVMASLGGLILLVGHAAFALHCLWLLLLPKTAEAGASLTSEPESMKLAAK